MCWVFFVCVILLAAAKLLQSCPTLCDPRDSSPPGSAIPGTLQARTLEWVAISFTNVRKQKVKVKSLSCFQLLATPWTTAHQAPPSMGFSRQEYWSGVPLPSLLFYLVITITLWEPPKDSKETHPMRVILSQFWGNHGVGKLKGDRGHRWICTWVCLTPKPRVKNFGCISRVWFQISTLHLLVNEVPTFIALL